MKVSEVFMRYEIKKSSRYETRAGAKYVIAKSSRSFKRISSENRIKENKQKGEMITNYKEKKCTNF